MSTWIDPMVIGNESYLPHATSDWKAYTDALQNPPAPPQAFIELKKLLEGE